MGGKHSDGKNGEEGDKRQSPRESDSQWPGPVTPPSSPSSPRAPEGQ